MNATCQQCDTVFRIDPAKLPEQRVRVRCAVCRGVFEIDAPAREDAPEERGRDDYAHAVAADPETQVAGSTAEPEEAGPAHERTTSADTAPKDVPVSPAPPATDAAPRLRTASPFGGSDPDAKARRLARALVSDMAIYHPERRDRSLAEGTLRKEFHEEIRKSWEEYVEQVGQEMARRTPHFRQALNEILAKGDQVF